MLYRILCSDGRYRRFEGRAVTGTLGTLAVVEIEGYFIIHTTSGYCLSKTYGRQTEARQAAKQMWERIPIVHRESLKEEKDKRKLYLMLRYWIAPFNNMETKV